ncbi:hypothetical protein, partial [Thiolapillus sp.]|uniref:hypothetical protein n=1 Tax=Thiolapillus sp. TaxID=2017437 RepID=UPI003AF4D553
MLLRTWLPYDWTPRSAAYFASPLALCARRVSSAAVRPRGYWGLPAFASLSMAGSEGNESRRQMEPRTHGIDPE